MQAYGQMLENHPLHVENFPAPLHYSCDYKQSCLLQSCSLMKAIGSPAGFEKIKKKIAFAKQKEKNCLISGEFNIGSSKHFAYPYELTKCVLVVVTSIITSVILVNSEYYAYLC